MSRIAVFTAKILIMALCNPNRNENKNDKECVIEQEKSERSSRNFMSK